MTRLVLLFAIAFFVTGCSALEQYHYTPAFNEVPTKVKIAFGDKYPNDEIKLDQTTCQKMYDGTMRYHLTAVTRKGETHEVIMTADGHEM